jgi:hypothetical protein
MSSQQVGWPVLDKILNYRIYVRYDRFMLHNGLLAETSMLAMRFSLSIREQPVMF